jgi:hypothetical protein
MIQIDFFINESPKKPNENTKKLIDREYIKGDSLLISKRFMQKKLYTKYDRKI